MRFRRRSREPEPVPKPAAPRPAPAPTPEQAAETDIARRVLAHAASPEEKLERLLAERSHKLEEQAARFESALEDIERREELLRDMRASVERMLRLGDTNLTEREAELEDLERDVAERRARLNAEEAELERRRSELGAVELKREAVEQRERALTAREEELEAKESGRLTDLAPPARAASVANRADTPAVELLFVPGPGYRLVEVDSRELRPGTTVDLDSETYVVTRIGHAPLPGDERGCAYLERMPPGSSASDGSS